MLIQETKCKSQMSKKLTVIQLEPGLNFQAREEQNVKRRVYDALNVLIAADILERDQKTVFYKERKSRKSNLVLESKTYLPEFLEIKKEIDF